MRQNDEEVVIWSQSLEKRLAAARRVLVDEHGDVTAALTELRLAEEVFRGFDAHLSILTGPARDQGCKERNRLRDEFRILRENADRRVLLGDHDAATEEALVAAATVDRHLAHTERMSQDNLRMGRQVITELSEQGRKLQGAMSGVGEIEGVMGEAACELTDMERRARQNRRMWQGLAGLAVAATVLIGYFKWLR